MMEVPDNGPVTEYFIADNFCLCLPLIYVHSRSCPQQPASHMLCGHPGFSTFQENSFFLRANLAIL